MPLSSGYRWYVGPYTGPARMQENETPDRYMDGRGLRMWETVMGLLPP